MQTNTLVISLFKLYKEAITITTGTHHTYYFKKHTLNYELKLAKVIRNM